MEEKLYSIGQLAKKTGMTVRTLRFYDEKGLLCPSHRTDTGRKLYGNEEIVALQNILTLKFLGYSLEQIHEIITNPNNALQQSLQWQKQEMLRKKEQLEKTIETLDHALALAEQEKDVHIDLFLSLIHGVMMEDKQKEFLKTKMPEELVQDIYDYSAEELVEYNKKFMDSAIKLKDAYKNKLPEDEVLVLLEEMINIMPSDLMERVVESTLQFDVDVELDESLFLSPFTNEEELWLMTFVDKLKLYERVGLHGSDE